jgi:hypothetical protein
MDSGWIMRFSFDKVTVGSCRFLNSDFYSGHKVKVGAPNVCVSLADLRLTRRLARNTWEHLLTLDKHAACERSSSTDGYMRVRLTLDDHSQLEFSEYVQHSAKDQINPVTYSYHWADAQGQLIRRWDYTPHFPALDGFLHHVHTGSDDTVAPSQPVNIFIVLDIISQLIRPA